MTTSANVESNDSVVTANGTAYELADIPLARKVRTALGDAGRDPYTFWTAYADAIERNGERWNELGVTPNARQELLALLTYFEHPSDNVREWPGIGLRLFAMLAELPAAVGVLLVEGERLNQALLSQKNPHDWAWWRALGIAILADVPNEQIARELGLTTVTVRKYRSLLTGTTSPGRQAA